VQQLETHRGGYGCIAWFGLVTIVAILGVSWFYRNFLKPGQIVLIQGGETEKVLYVGATEADAEELGKLVKASDDLGLEKLKATTNVLAIASGTKVRVIEHNWFKSLFRVRILEGKETGKSGWTSKQFLSEPPKEANAPSPPK
jgi:hypothetical protein